MMLMALGPRGKDSTGSSRVEIPIFFGKVDDEGYVHQGSKIPDFGKDFQTVFFLAHEFPELVLCMGIE